MLSIIAAPDDEEFELRTFGGYSMHTDTIYASASAFVSAINGDPLSFPFLLVVLLSPLLPYLSLCRSLPCIILQPSTRMIYFV
jgi:hypothetical protein